MTELRSLAVAILGTADSTYNNASDLLDDFFPEDTIVYLPSYISSDHTGLRVTFDWLKDADIEYVRVKRSQLFTRLISTSVQRIVMIVIGVEGSEDIIESCLAQGVPVYDLTRGLYSVTAADMALCGSEANGEASLTQAEGDLRSGQDDLVTEPHRDSELLKRVKILEEQMSSVRAHMGIGEQGWEPSPADILDVADILVDEEHFAQTKEVVDDRVKYYKSVRGKMRKAGKSKARPGETEVYLTPEEADKVE